MLSINTNLSSMIVQNSMGQATSKLNQAIERMSTGFKINHASDNAANYSISTNMTTKMSAYQVAEDNTEMGLDMVTSASETLSEMENYATRLRALATQAQNGTYGKQSLNAIQTEANALVDEIERLYNSTQYNGISLFNRTEYDIPSHLPQAQAKYGGFIEDPKTYTDEEVEAMTSITGLTTVTSGEKYKISSAEDLAQLAKIVNSGVDTTGAEFVLADDIDLKEWCEKNGNWIPIGDYNTDTSLQFKGTFDGNGHVISNLTINAPDKSYQGLFGYTRQNSKIKNITLSTVKINGKTNTGGLIGWAEYTNVENCCVLGNVTGASSNTGLLLGYSSGNTINCHSEGDVKSKANWVGGLIGSCWGNVENCYSKANIVGASGVGGLLGHSTPSRIISNSYAQCIITTNGFGGGFAGTFSSIYGENKMENCYSFSSVNSNNLDKVGTFIGYTTVTNDDINYKVPNINNCYSAEQENINFIGGSASISSGSAVILPNYDLSNVLKNIKNVNFKGVSSELQVGTKGNENSRINFTTNFVYDFSNLRNNIDSEFTLKNIDDFADLLSSKQTELGAVTNRLESALDEIAIQYDNLASSRSTLRDADMAELSSTYIQQQILQQASATLLATANQSPSIALQLI